MADPTRVMELLLSGGTREELDGALAGTPEPERLLVHRLREQMVAQRSREAELSALYETARDLTAIRDLDQILAAIVRRARQLLGADMTYLSLNDEEEGASYMKVTDGALTAEFRRLRLPLGTGLLGLVAQSGAPYFTEDYQSDARFVHREFIDEAVAGEQIRAILGVPLEVEGVVIGALLAVHRRVRRFPAAEVALLTSFAAHAAVALENARLFERARRAVAQADAATEALRRAAHAHDLFTDVLLHRGGVGEVAAVLAQVLGGRVAAYDDEGRLLAGDPDGAPAPAGFDEAVATARSSGRCAATDDGAWVAVAVAGEDHLGTLVLRTTGPMGLPERRTLERAALVVAMVLLFDRSVAEAESRVRGELLVDVLESRVAPALLRERLRHQGARLEGGLAIAVGPREDGRSRARTVATVAAERHGLGVLHEGHPVVLAAAEPLELGRALAARLGEATVGVATVPVPPGASGGLDAVPEAYAEARRTQRALECLGRTGEVSDPGGLGLARLLLGSNGPAELGEFLDVVAGPVLEYDAQRGTSLVETLQAWFDTGGGLGETASRLHVHPNTVTQRLDRVARLLGEGWRDPSRRLDLQLALQVARLRR